MRRLVGLGLLLSVAFTAPAWAAEPAADPCLPLGEAELSDERTLTRLIEIKRSPGARLLIALGQNRGIDHKSTLQFAVADARRLCKVLVAHGGFEHPVVLQDLTPSTLHAVLRRLADVPTPDLLMFYYSGHARNGHLEMGDGRIAFPEIAQVLSAIDARITVTAIDACDAGSLVRSRGDADAPVDAELAEMQRNSERQALAEVGATLAHGPVALRFKASVGRQLEPSERDAPGPQLAGSVYIGASSAGQSAIEANSVGGGVFTYYFVRALYGDFGGPHDTSPHLPAHYGVAPNEVTLLQAFNHAAERTRIDTRQAHRWGFEPFMQNRLDGTRSDFTLTRLSVAQGRLALVGDWGGDVEVTPADLASSVDSPHRRWTRKLGHEPLELSLAAGDYRITRPAKEREGQYHMWARVQADRLHLVDAPLDRWEFVPFGAVGTEKRGLDDPPAESGEARLSVEMIGGGAGPIPSVWRLTAGALLEGTWLPEGGQALGAALGLRHLLSPEWTLGADAIWATGEAGGGALQASRAQVLGLRLSLDRVLWRPSALSVALGARLGGEYGRQTNEALVGQGEHLTHTHAWRAAPMLRLRLPLTAALEAEATGAYGLRAYPLQGQGVQVEPDLSLQLMLAVAL